MDQVRAGDQGDLPGRPVRSVVLPQEDAARLCDFLEVPEEGHRVQWAHRHDLLVDVRLTPADWTNLWAADADGPHLAADGRLVVGDSRYELTVGWPRRDAGTECRYCPADVLAARVAARIAADSQVDDVRGYDGTDGGAS